MALADSPTATATAPATALALPRLPQAPSTQPARPRAGMARFGEFLAVGGATPLLFPLAWILRKTFGLDSAELAVGFLTFHAAFVINDPHFAVTYLLFYRDARARAFGSAFPPSLRARYLVAGVIVPALLAAWAIGALATRSTFALGLMIELMFALVGWHYVKQGFGVMVVLAARRGMRFRPRERAVVLAHCLAGWAYAWANPAAPSTEVEEKGVVYMTIARPQWFERGALVVLVTTALLLVAVLVAKWRREGRLPPLTPMIALLCSIWSWSIYSSIDPIVVYVIPALHSIQYLYFVSLMRGNEAREREGPPWFETSARARLGLLAAGAVALAWVLFHGAPGLLDAALVPHRGRFVTSPLGPTPYLAAFYTFVNVHHFVMDSVVWRRDNPETRYLLA